MDRHQRRRGGNRGDDLQDGLAITGRERSILPRHGVAVGRLFDMDSFKQKRGGEGLRPAPGVWLFRSGRKYGPDRMGLIVGYAGAG